jgi:trans-2,3-dihydro-3-hydroxyanthranilate isomerase
MSPTSLAYLHLDVFTATRFEGNQLAVYLDPPADLPPQVMQAIAREMNFSETTFVFAPERRDTDCRVRIFTPASELPMAGHPTIGTAFALAHAGRLAAGLARTVFGEGVGPVPVDLEWAGGRLTFAWMTQAQPEFGPTLDDVSALAAGIGLAPGDLRPDSAPVQEVSCGVPFVIVPVISRAAVDRAAPDARLLARAFQEAGLPQRHVYLFTRDGGDDAADVYTRMFAPEIGIMEDPATGSASGPLGAYLVRHGLFAGELREPLRNLQGRAMGRPSWISIAPVLTGERITAVRVGGQAVIVGTGTVELT